MPAPPISSPSQAVHADLAQLMRLRHQARDLSFQPRQPLTSLLAGRHTSRLRGRGLDFEELRAYRPGDDTRSMDWKATARLGKPQVRVYTEERDRPALFVVDQRMSMFFGSRRSMKSVAAAEVVALGAWRSIDQGDRAGAIVFDDETMSYVRPHRSAENVARLLGEVVRFNRRLAVSTPASPERGLLNRALERASRTARHDHLVVIVSDLRGLDSESERLLKAIAQHNDLIVVLVRDPLESQLPQAGRLVFESGGLQLEVDTTRRSLRERFLRRFEERLASGQGLLCRLEVPLLQIDPGEGVLDQLQRQLGGPGA